MDNIAHIRYDGKEAYAHKTEDGRYEPLVNHLQDTAKLAESFARKFGMGDYGKFLGEIHDIGKYCNAFQRRIRGEAIKCEHSAAGAYELLEYKKTILNYILAYCIAGHHSNLPNGGSMSDNEETGTLVGKLKRQAMHKEDCYAYKKDLSISELFPNSPIGIKPESPYSLQFMTRMLFSCLVDADYLATENFMSDGLIRRGIGLSMKEIKAALGKKLLEFAAPDNAIKKKRNEILEFCIKKAKAKTGIFSLTVPTGGGKTISSLAFAVNHAIYNQLDRIIYVIPYTSIIDQTVNEFSDIFGEENVLAHYSTVSFDDVEEESQNIIKLATENWDAPIVVTTNVQFFESLYSNKTSKCRKLHNIVNSVIIFDEAQMIPNDYIIPCVNSICELVKNYHSTAVFCSATQPAFRKLISDGVIQTDSKIAEICDNTEALYAFFKRTTIQNDGMISTAALVDNLKKEKRFLCILNNKKRVADICKKLGDDVYHLTTNMYPNHRKRVIENIKNAIKDKEKECRVVATSLVEAGVDFDFPVVFREAAGVDSIIQAAGRCNREGKENFKNSIVHTFSFKQNEEEHSYKMPSELKCNFEVAQTVMKKYEDISCPEAIQMYFELLYNVKGNRLDKKQIMNQLDVKPQYMPFSDVAEQVKLIEQDTVPMLIPKEDDAIKLKETIGKGNINRDIIREAGKYCVNIYPYQKDLLSQYGAISDLGGYIILENVELYDEKIGLIIPAGGEAFFG